MPAVHEFTHAIVRRPGRSVVNGLRAGSGPAPDFDGVASEHAVYAAALVHAGVAVTILAALEQFSDSIFVEDPALAFAEGAILLRPGAASRAGEAAALEPTLRDKFTTVLALGAGHVDGGDVLDLGERVMIGLSSRTDREGAEDLARLLARLGKSATIAATPEGVLHLKSDCALIGEETVLTTARLSATGVFKGFRQIVVPAREEAAANALRVNDALFLGARFPRTADLLAKEDYRVVPLPTEHIGRLDAGLSCMSLRWRAAG